MARIGNIYGIFVMKNRIKILDPDVGGVVDLYHISLEICSVHGTAIPVECDILFAGNLYHAIQFRIGEHIICRDEFDVGIAVDDHIVCDRDPDLGNQEQRQKRQDEQRP